MVSERVEKIAAALTPSVSTSGKKDILFNRLRDCGDKHITKIDEVTFEWKQEKAPEGTVPKWIILDGEPAEKRQGINMLSRAQEGYFGPTNKENVDGAVKCKYLTRPEERIEHPAFVRKKPPLLLLHRHQKREVLLLKHTRQSVIFALPAQKTL
mmetsp:Transcript_4248/g.9510  ORF Transcript_4248/g.9510 Transcript_4248/m.9510 type:complete len:154 (-) Transcript_4248:704-1165(-)